MLAAAIVILLYREQENLMLLSKSDFVQADQLPPIYFQPQRLIIIILCYFLENNIFRLTYE